MAGSMARRYAADAVVHEIGFLSVDEDCAMTEDGKREEEEERVVYYDLDDASRRDTYPVPESKPKRNDKNPPKQRVLEQPKQLFASHTALAVGGATVPEEEAEDDDEDDDASNPFAALLHVHRPPPTYPQSLSPPRRTATRRSPVQRVTPPSPPPQGKPPRVKRSLSPSSHPPARLAVPLSQSRPITARTSVSTTRSLVPAIEAADARPSRWTRTTPAAITTGGSTKRRRGSTSSTTALTKQHAEAKRRKSLPAGLEDNGPHRTGRRLSDVLHKATTLLSQDRTMPLVDHNPLGETHDDDGIADTVTEMREEPFQAQFFSPTKSSSAHKRLPRADAVLTKIRGRVGEAIRKATRTTHRDLTLLRSQGQTLLAHTNHDSAGDIHSRDFVVVQLDQLVKHPHLITYDGVVVDFHITPSDDDSERTTLPTKGCKLVIVLAASDATHHLSCGAYVKIFAPFQIVNEWSAPGTRRRRQRKFLIGTSLFEMLSGRQ